MKDRWAYLNVLLETRVGSYKPSHLWGGVWASIDCMRKKIGSERSREGWGGGGKRDTESRKRSGGSNLPHEFQSFHPEINSRWRGRSSENPDPSIGHLAQFFESIIPPQCHHNQPCPESHFPHFESPPLPSPSLYQDSWEELVGLVVGKVGVWLLGC